MATQVFTTYTPSLNTSTTVRDGVVSKVTTWTSGTGPSGTVRLPQDMPGRRKRK